MSILLIRTARGQSYAQKIASAIDELGVKSLICGVDEIGQTITEHRLTPDNTLMHARTAGELTNQKISVFEEQGFRVINPVKTLNLTNHKYAANEHARKNSIPGAVTFKIGKSDFGTLEELRKKYGTVVVKPIYSQGEGIFCHRLEKGLPEEDIKILLQGMPGDEIQVQQYIDYRRLIRVIVLGYKALKEATTYDEPGQSWKCSVCLNRNVKAYREDSPKLFELAERTAKAFGAQINYLDFFEDFSGNFILNEINTACNLSFHERATGVPIARHIAEFLVEMA